MELTSYAIDFVSFFVQNFKKIEKIKKIILFGSVARGESDKDSDIDLFVDVISDEQNLELKVEKIKKDFLDSSKYKKYWKLLGTENEINIITGKLEKWKLKDTMLGNSIILYERYAPRLEGGKSRIILSWETIKPDSKRVMLSKKLFGYAFYGKKYAGLLEKYNGSKIGSNVVIIDAEYLNTFIKIFRDLKISVKIRRVFEYD